MESTVRIYGLKGLILDTSGKSANNHARSMREIAEYIGREICTDIQRSIENEEKSNIPIMEYDKNRTGLTRDIQ